jgi:hypothetical protein
MNIDNSDNIIYDLIDNLDNIVDNFDDIIDIISIDHLEECHQCPICLENHNLVFPFGCVHGICSFCSSKWTKSCPMCRKEPKTEKWELNIEYIYLNSEQRRHLDQQQHEYLIEYLIE